MIVNGKELLLRTPIVDMVSNKMTAHGTSYGLGEAGYDIRIKQEVAFRGRDYGKRVITVSDGLGGIKQKHGRFALASAMERFTMPNNLTGIVHDKSTWARRGLSVFNTVIEPGWEGFLTLELVYHGEGDLVIPAGSGIAQVIFHFTIEEARYTGKYQHQADKPVAAIATPSQE
jgi:dCTP deaminase